MGKKYGRKKDIAGNGKKELGTEKGNGQEKKGYAPGNQLLPAEDVLQVAW